ncbi:MAG: glycosyltransferase family 2 protein [Anaerolineales bacterium]|nr:glycosyltransferase family 2 protein [Anaerolineales bacterium]
MIKEEMTIIVFVLLFWASVFFVLYTYFGYPIILEFLAGFKRTQIDYPEHFPTITLLIAAYNEEASIEEKIKNSLALQYPVSKLQILVAADGSTDHTPDIVRAYADQGVDLSYIPERGGKMAAIVRALSTMAHGEVVIISDANNQYDKHAIEYLAAPFSDPAVGVTTGAKIILEDGRHLSSSEGLYWRYESRIKSNETKLGTCTIAVGEIIAFRKNQFSAPTQKIINDDHYLVLDFIKKGYKVVYVPQARSYEYVSRTAADEVMRRTRMNAGLFQTIFMSGRFLPYNRPFIVWQIISHKFCRAFVPFVMILALLLNILIVYLNFIYNISTLLMPALFGKALLVFQVTFYFAAFLGSMFNFEGRLGKVFYLPTFLVNSNIAIVRGLYSYLTNKQQHIWKRVNR